MGSEMCIRDRIATGLGVDWLESARVVSAFELSKIAAVNVERDLAAGLLYS